MGQIWAGSGKSDSNLADGSGDEQTLDLVGGGGGGGGGGGVTRVSAVGGGESRGQMRAEARRGGGALLYAGEVRMVVSFH